MRCEALKVSCLGLHVSAETFNSSCNMRRACRFAARPNQGQHEDGKKCCAQPSASTACFELSLFLFAVVMVLLVNVTFVSALLVDMSLSPSTPTGAGSGSQVCGSIVSV